ncbi:hypothetical protein EB796_000516 [Bugula neritina]|uniref:Cadherin domain-containing protein n=1 Tax=Bugula neritina TaxID=10212 RepID=A0A7J7KSZ0_BUGNE|nr:hypothetical protein EB796_000516 [Bugula neritina]
MAGNTEDDAFQLHPTNGQLTLRRALSKQDGRQFDLTIMVSDGGLNDTAHVYIDLLDYNDYKPNSLETTMLKLFQKLQQWARLS